MPLQRFHCVAGMYKHYSTYNQSLEGHTVGFCSKNEKVNFCVVK